MTAIVEEMTSLGVIPTRIDIRDARPGEVLTVPLFFRGDKSVVERLPVGIGVQVNSLNRLSIEVPQRRGWRASREIALYVPAQAAASVKAIDEVFEIDVAAGEYRQKIQIPIRVHFRD